MLRSTEILDQIALMFLNYGIRSITMDDISSELGISKKTLYQHVVNKEDLIRKVISNEILKRSNEVRGILRSNCNVIEQMIEIQKIVFHFAKIYSNAIEFDLKRYYPAIYRELYEKYGYLLEKLFARNIRKGKKEGFYRIDLNESIIAKMYASRILTIPQNKIMSVDDFTSEEYMHEMILYHLRALLNKESIPVLDKYVYELKQKTKMP